jgi:hypothetical protein
MRHKFPTRATRSRFLSGLDGIALCLSATGAAAQSGEASELRLTLYFWIAGIDGTVGASDSGGQVDAGGGNGKLRIYLGLAGGGMALPVRGLRQQWLQARRRIERPIRGCDGTILTSHFVH